MRLEHHRPRSREQWLDLRKGRMTSSVVASALGLNPYQTPLEAWLDVTGRGTFDGNKATFRGSYLEQPVLNYPTRSGHIKRKPAPFVTGAHWSGDSADCLYLGGGDLMVGEGKTVGMHVARTYGSEESNHIPEHVTVQCYWHLLHWPEASRVLVPALFGEPFELREYVVERDDNLIGGVAQAARRWWRDYVQADKPPPAVFRDDEGLKAAWPVALEGKQLEPTDEMRALVLEHVEARGQRLVAEKVEKAASARIRQLLEDAEGVDGGDWRATYRNSKGSAKTDWEALAKELGATEEDEQRFTSIRPGARRLTTWKKKPKKGAKAA